MFLASVSEEYGIALSLAVEAGVQQHPLDHDMRHPDTPGSDHIALRHMEIPVGDSVADGAAVGLVARGEAEPANPLAQPIPSYGEYSGSLYKSRYAETKCSYETGVPQWEFTANGAGRPKCQKDCIEQHELVHVRATSDACMAVKKAVDKMRNDWGNNAADNDELKAAVEEKIKEYERIGVESECDAWKNSVECFAGLLNASDKKKKDLCKEDDRCKDSNYKAWVRSAKRQVKRFC
jgi:hypothetical protein